MQLSLHNGSSTGVTVISNIFIDFYMPRAHGEFVKIYLYLLRCLRGGQTTLDLAGVADVFDCTEADVLRTLRYWESQRLVVLSGKDSLTSIDFLDPMIPADVACNTAIVEAAPAKEPAKRSTVSDTPLKIDTMSPTSKRKSLTKDRVKELQQNDDIKQILFIAEQYMGTTLSRSVVDEFLYIYEHLHFSVDLIDYLIEYCVSKGSNDIHYIKKVAFNWFDSGIDTVAKAKLETTTYNKNYFTILRAFGITSRNPVPAEINMINHWLKDYGFTMDILIEACSRTVASTGKSSFPYADKILSEWKEKGVRHLTDIQALDTLHRQLQSDRAEKKSPKTSQTSRGFNDIQHRHYDYNDLENKLLNE